MNMILYENRTFLVTVLKQLEKSLTAKNPVISPNFLVWKISGKVQFPHHPKLCGNCAFPQNFHIRKLGEITVFYAVFLNFKYWPILFMYTYFPFGTEII